MSSARGLVCRWSSSPTWPRSWITGTPSGGRHRCEASGHHLRQPRCRCLEWVHAEDHRVDGARRRHPHPCPGLRPGRPVRVLHGRHDRPGDRAGRAAARAEDDPRRNRSCGGRRHRQGDPHLLPGHRARTAHPPRPRGVPVLYQDSERARSREGVPGAPRGTDERPRQGHLRRRIPRPAQGHPPMGSAAARGPREHPPADARDERCERQDGALQEHHRRLLNTELVLYPDAGHGGVFQFHEDFVKRALAFLSENSRTRA